MYYNALVRSLGPMMTVLREMEEQTTDWGNYFAPLSISETDLEMVRLKADVEDRPGDARSAADWDIVADAAAIVSLAFAYPEVNEALLSQMRTDYADGQDLYEEAAQWLMVDCLFNIRFLMIATSREIRKSPLFRQSREALKQLSVILTEVPIAVDSIELRRLAALGTAFLESVADDRSYVDQFHDFSPLGIPMSFVFDCFGPLDDDDDEEGDFDGVNEEFDLFDDTPWAEVEEQSEASHAKSERRRSDTGAIDIEGVNPVQSVISDVRKFTGILAAVCEDHMSGAA